MTEPVLGDSGGDIEALASTLTPTLGLPYPSPTDPVAAGANNMRDLALALDSTTKLVGPNTPEIIVDPAAGATRPGTYNDEIAQLFFYGAYFHTNNSVVALARWCDRDGTGTKKWWILGGPVVMSDTLIAPGNFGAGLVNDPDVYLDLPKWCDGRLTSSVACLVGVVDITLTDSAGHSASWSCNGNPWAFASVRTHWTLMQGRCYIQYYSAGGCTIANRHLNVEIERVYAG